MYRLFLMVVLIARVAIGQVILYEEHFTNGVTDIDWVPGWSDSLGIGDSMQVDILPDNPSGDQTVGFVENVLSGGMVGTAVGGTLDMTDYMVQGWVLVTPNWGPSAMAQYKGLVARFQDQVGHTYYQFVADFNTLASGGPKLRLRLYNGNESVVIHDFFEDEIPGGVPQEASWHHMGFFVEGNNLWCYWDFEELAGCPYHDEYGSPLQAGKFGLYVFNFSGDDATYCDDIFVTDEYYNPQISAPMAGVAPRVLHIEPNFPNPVTSSTTIPLTLNRSGELSLVVYDLSGAMVADLSAGWLKAGEYRFMWNGTSTSDESVASGSYLVRATSGGQTAERTITVLR